jgi:hypothetical protein
VNLVQFDKGAGDPKKSINVRDVLINEEYARFKKPPECNDFLLDDAPAAALDPDLGASFTPELPSTAAQFVNTSIVRVPRCEDEAAPPVRIPSPLPSRAFSPMIRPTSPLKVPTVYGPETEMPLQILQVMSNFYLSK